MSRATLAVIACSIALLSAGLLAAEDQVRWIKTVAPDHSYSLYQPEGWSPTYGQGNVRFSNTARDEEIVVTRMARASGTAMSAYVEMAERSFRRSEPSFRVSNLSAQGEVAAFAISYGLSGKQYLGPGVVVLRKNTAWWVSYTCPAGNDLRRGADLVQRVAQSIAEGEGAAPPPAVTSPPLPPSVTSPTARPNVNPIPAPRPGSTGGLVGRWTSGSYAGDLYNPGNGAYVQAAYTAESYTFNADGTYRYAIAASGQLITGVVNDQGTYETTAQGALLHRKTQSWYPAPGNAQRRPAYKDKPSPADFPLTIKFQGPGQITIQDTGSPNTFQRASDNK